MSCRDLRNFTETMRLLGYPRLISLSNFRLPNFLLVAEILIWLVSRFDSNTTIQAECQSVEERVSMIRQVAEFMALKTNIKLNTKKLYQADGHAVHELLKIASALYEAQNTSAMDEILSGNVQRNVTIDTSSRLSELKHTRQLASQLTVSGASLFDLLGREVQLGEIRNTKVARQFDTAAIEAAVKEVIENTNREIEETKQQIDNVKTTQQNLELKIERRQIELERNQKRLETLRKVRPAFMEEFEKLELELRAVYDDYLHKCHYLTYLEHIYEDTAKVEREKFEQRQEATKRQLEQLRGQDAAFESVIDGSDSIFSSNLREKLLVDSEINVSSVEQVKDMNVHEPENKSREPMRQRRIYGSMSGRQRGIIHDTDVESDSDSDLLIDGDLDDDDDDDLDDDEHEILDAAARHEIASAFNSNKADKRSINKIEHTDEDF